MIDAGVDDIKCSALAMVPPETPPFASPTCPYASTHVAPFRSFRNFATAHAPRSHGTESYPTQFTTHVSFALAAASCLSMTSRINVGSPVMSQ